MKINIRTVGVELSADVEGYIHKKLSHLERFGHMLGQDAALHLILSKTTDHHRSGDEAFSAEIQLHAMGRVISAKSFGQSIQAAIDGLKDELSKMVTGAADKERTLARRGAAIVKNFLRRNKN